MDTTDHADADDPYLWLEEIDSPRAHRWILPRNAATLTRLAEGPRAEAAFERAVSILDADDRIAWPVLRGRWGYNLWRDGDHPRGLWRRARWSELSRRSPGVDDPAWQVLLDVDELAAAEDENWVYAGTVVHRPEDRRALIRLSRGGSDAVVLREFDIERRRIVPPSEGGFHLPESKCQACWLDADTLLVAAPLGTDDVTDSGYARSVRLWHRGTDPADAPVLLRGERGDVTVGATRDTVGGRVAVTRALDFHNVETWFWSPGTDPGTNPPRRLPVPTDCRVDWMGDWLLLHPRSEMTVAGRSHPAGSVLAVPWAALDTADPDASDPVLPRPGVLFTPDDHSTVEDITWGRDRLLITVLDGMASRLRALRIPAAPTDPAGDPPHWAPLPLLDVPMDVSIDVLGCDALSDGADGEAPHPDEALLAVSGPVTPPALLRLDESGTVHLIARSPHRFDASGVGVSHHEAISDDGTRVPYTVLRGPGPDGPRPTILYGYGGFEVAMRPSYAALRGALWLEEGGSYVIAGIRGGGEYGPGWHEAARRERRPRAFEDFAAVARDLVATGVCTTDRLGATGGSNGGLLMGVMLTRYPEAFAALAIAVPLLDMKRYHLLLAGASWVAEYGDPDTADWSDFLADYSPYQNMRPATERRYPPVLMTSSTRDDRVHPGHARKATARLEELGHRVDYYENTEGGHAGAADNAQEARKAVLLYEFFRRELGLD